MVDGIPDHTEKTVLLPVRIKNGKVELYDGSKLPKIRDALYAELIVPALAIEDNAFLENVSNEQSLLMFPQGETLYVKMNLQYDGNIDEALIDSMLDHTYLEIILEEDLVLHLRGTKRAYLQPCRCKIPLFDKSVGSLNQAYTAISTVFEPYRLSHSGNVFTKIFFKNNNGYEKIEKKRMELEGSYLTMFDSRSIAEK